VIWKSADLPNSPPFVKASSYDVDPSAVAQTRTWAAIVVGSTEFELTALHLPATYNTGALAGYFTGGARTIPGFAGGTHGTVIQVGHVWTPANVRTIRGCAERSRCYPSRASGGTCEIERSLAKPSRTDCKPENCSQD
jgi:hypothetical protein